MTDKTLDELRELIDNLDIELLKKINQRAIFAQQVAEVKERSNTTNDIKIDYYRPEREMQVLRRIKENNLGPLSDEEVTLLFRQLMSACLALEEPVRVAFLGPEGTFTQQAVIKHFGSSVIGVPSYAIDEVFREVSAKASEYGIVPVENSTEGVVNNTLDNFLDSNLKICGEVILKISQNLLISKNTRKKAITRIYSHTQSFAQCRKWLDAHYPLAERVAVESNAEAAKHVSREWNSAAIAGDMVASIYNLEKVVEHIEDRPDNSTRFLIIGHQDVQPSGVDKTSIIVHMRNQPGALFSILSIFKQYNIDLTRIETRPERAAIWNYVFFIDFVGHKSDPIISQALEELNQCVNDIHILGSYPQGLQ